MREIRKLYTGLMVLPMPFAFAFAPEDALRTRNTRDPLKYL